MRWFLAGTLVMAALWASAGLVTSSSQKSSGPLDAFFSDLHRRGLFDGAVAISDSGDTVFEKGFGSANAARGVPFTPDTPADGASLAKTFTAALILSLQRERRLDLDTAAQLLLPELPYPTVTLRHLLAHTSGIPVADYDFFDAYISKGQVRTTETLLRVLGELKLPLRSPPDTSFEYSSLGYDLAALAAVRAAGKPYFDLLKDRFFTPLGMSSAFVRPGRLSEFPGVRTLAYRRDSGRTVLNDVFDLEAFHGGSNIYLSARDLDKWNRAFLTSNTPGGPDGLEFARIGTSSSGLTLGSWYRALDGGSFWYSGHLQGFHAEAFRDVKTRQSIVYMSNNTIEPWLQKGVIRSVRAILGGGIVQAPRAPAVDEISRQDRAAFSGTWMLRDQALQLEGSPVGTFVTRGGARYPAFPEGRKFFYVPGADFILGLSREKNDEPARIYVSTVLDEQWANRSPSNASVK
jgi:CubicO group peptidase (beta-lactamase class C family)